MEKEEYYKLAFRQGAIIKEEAQKYIALLPEDTLDRITHLNFDRQLLKPIMEMAWKEMEKSGLMDFNYFVTNIINNKNRMFKLMSQYCLEKE